uniref:uncharacterized protein At2g29880-like n=1 Tax=Erigeron canadensis TaxID=72917 RepID=UPI001CB8E0E0|nr:uncharacterized protein At2g29880-like [Erigeron canadensis]
MELHVSRKYVPATIDFKYANTVQRLMDPTFKYTWKTVKNRMRNLEVNFYILRNMLRSSYGFSWDQEKACVIADKDVWDKYLDIHPQAGQFRKQPFPHYAKLCIIYGREYAAGPQTDGLGGKVVVGENQVSPIVEAKDLHVIEDVPSYYGVVESVISKLKRAGDDETCAESLEKQKNAIEDFGPTYIENSNRRANQGINNVASDMMDKVVTQMKDLPSLILDESLIAMSVIGRSAALSKMFDRLDEDGKVRMAQLVANGSIS